MICARCWKRTTRRKTGRACPILQFASWIGGDRDGNPNVTADVTLETITTQRAAARAVYLEEVAYLREHLTQSLDEVGVSPELLEWVQEGGFPTRAHDEVYRQAMSLIWDQLNPDSYRTHIDLLADLRLISDICCKIAGSTSRMGCCIG